jgi:hypothetical protein
LPNRLTFIWSTLFAFECSLCVNVCVTLIFVSKVGRVGGGRVGSGASCHHFI